MNASSSTQPFVPLRLAGRPLALKVAIALLGTLFLAASSWIEVPMYPVPMTMQTFAVTMVGALCGWRLGFVTVTAWLVQAMIGFPVLAGGAGGMIHFVGPTAGYLVAFPLAAALVGWLAERGWTAHIAASLAAMLTANALILLLGAAWLSSIAGLSDAVAYGVTPFVAGAVVKSLLASAVLEGARRRAR